jgi:hypothetical protein
MSLNQKELIRRIANRVQRDETQVTEIVEATLA